ncbi:MAG TPA: MBL fold metallo-hydrolase [Pyrinomonadaceae bacterium]|nr:MBL fold metallo-hydrolase [Pyrinomonadaceae bacterium]
MKQTTKRMFTLSVLLVAATVCAAAQTRVSTALSKQLIAGESYIWYMQHSGWAIRTKNHFLVFDYIGDGMPIGSRTLADGIVNPDEIKKHQVTVFVTHGHNDHYSEQIFDWGKTIANITYVFGWNLPKSGNYFRLEPRQKKPINGIDVETIISTDLGVGFLVKVDGLSIFHAGDHAKWAETFKAAYEAEIDLIANASPKIDILFVPIAKGMSCEPNESILDGAYFAIRKLRPKAAFPMHVRCADKIGLYREFAENGAKHSLRSSIFFPERPGQIFQYTDSRLVVQ